MVRERVLLIMNKRKKISGGIWKRPEQREVAEDWTWPGLSTREAGEWGRSRGADKSP